MTDRPSTRYVFVPAAALALLVMLGGCTNPFTPANPEPPTAGAPVEDFSSIEAMLTTMAIGIQTRSQAGADAYIHCFAESTTTGERAFYAYHDPTAKAAWIQGHPGQAAPEPWPAARAPGVAPSTRRTAAAAATTIRGVTGDPCGSSARRAAWPSTGRPGCRPGRWR